MTAHWLDKPGTVSRHWGFDSLPSFFYHPLRYQRVNRVMLFGVGTEKKDLIICQQRDIFLLA